MEAPQQSEIFLGRQPILDPRRRVVGYELLFRSGRNGCAGVNDGLAATSTVITHTMGLFGIDAALGQHTGFINVPYELLMSDVLDLLPKKRIVLELLETIPIDERVIERCRELKAQGFRLALDDFEYAAVYEPLFDIVDVIKFDLTLSTSEEIEESSRCLRQHRGIRLLAEKVEDIAQFERYRDQGFDLFQGYFFARPTVLCGRKPNSNQTALLRVLSQVMSDTEISEIERSFKACPDLVLGLLQLVNSAGMGLRVKIRSVQQALVLLGRRQLQRWVQLSLYAQGSIGAASPLLQLAATRARTMELLSHQLDQTHSGREDGAFMVGLLSLADAVLGLKLDEIFSQINLSDEVKEAVLRHKGFFGQMLALVQKVETGDFEGASDLTSELGITPAELTNAHLDAMQWAASLNEA